VIQVLSQLATSSIALLVYPGLLAIILFGGAAEVVWDRLSVGRWMRPEVRWRRPSPVLSTVALSSMLAAVQLAAPFNLVSSSERSLVVAAIALSWTAWVAIAFGVELFGEPGLMLLVQCCWLLAVLGPAVEPQSLRPQVIGAVLVPALIPVKVASAFLYLLCLPALLKMWPLTPPGERRSHGRFDPIRGLCWWPYCGLFATLYFPPPPDSLVGILRFVGVSAAVGAVCLLAGWAMGRRGAEPARGLYRRALAPYAALVLVLVVVTSVLVR
jgi:hypothetical protein